MCQECSGTSDISSVRGTASASVQHRDASLKAWFAANIQSSVGNCPEADQGQATAFARQLCSNQVREVTARSVQISSYRELLN